MFTANSRVILALVCIMVMGVASSPVAPSSKAIAAAPASNSAGGTTAGKADPVGLETARLQEDGPLQEEGNHGFLVEESSQIKLATRKHLRRQSNRLILARKARSAPEDTSDEDAHTNTDLQHRDMISCVSSPANDTIPAAHIRGHGTRPFARHDDNYDSSNPASHLVKGYQQRWQCCEYGVGSSHNAHAFVDGGMIFNQTDKSLRVPVCGYYHISSQIYFRIDGSTVTENSKSVYHMLKFERNCPSWPDTNPVTVLAKSAVSHDDTTTSTSDVIRLCAGGKVWVEIPDLPNGMPCCPMGDEEGTFISAFLIAETTCHWPPKITMENLNCNN